MNLRTIVIASMLSIKMDSIVALARPAVKGRAQAKFPPPRRSPVSRDFEPLKRRIRRTQDRADES